MTTAKDRIIAETKLSMLTRLGYAIRPNSNEAKLFRMLVQKQEMLESSLQRESKATAKYATYSVIAEDAAATVTHLTREVTHKDSEIAELKAKLGMNERIMAIIAYHANSALEKSTATAELLRMVLRFILEDARKVLPKDHDTTVQPEPAAGIADTEDKELVNA